MRTPKFFQASLGIFLTALCLAAFPHAVQAQHGTSVAAPHGKTNGTGLPTPKLAPKKTVVLQPIVPPPVVTQKPAPDKKDPPPTETPPAAGTAPPDPKLLVVKLNAASTQERAAIQSTDAAFQNADVLKKTLVNFASPGADSSLSSRLAALSGLADQLGQVADVRDAVTKAQATDAELATAETALQAVTSNPDVTANSDPTVSQALNAAQATQKDAEARLQQLKALCNDAGAGSLADAVTSVTSALTSLSSDLTAAVTTNPINNKDFASSTDPAAIRQTLAQGMDSLIQSFTDEYAFRTAYTGLKPALKSAGALDKTVAAIDTSQQDFEKKHAPPTAVAGWFQFLTGAKAGDDLKALDTQHKQIAKDIEAGSTSSDAVLGAPATLADAQAESVQLKSIVNAWQPLVTAWETYDPTVTGALSGAGKILSAQTLTLTAFSDVTADVNDLLTGNQTNFVTQQVNLFYFTDVQRLMEALNARTQPMTEGQGDEQTKADQARQDLLDAEGEVAKSLTRVNEAKSQLRTIQEDIRQANANAADAANQAATAHVLYNHLLNQQANLQTQLQSAAGNPAASQQVQDVKTPLDAQVASALAARDAADANKASTQQAVSGLQTQAAALPQKLLNAQDTLSAARGTLDEQRTIAGRRAEEEVQAFANARDNAPYFFAPARFLSTDPAQRVKLYGYPDSKTILVQGLPKDVQDVMDVIAEFDRPSPQARITLWSLQFNGSDNASLSEVVQKVNQHLLLTRTLIGLVQDKLRDSLGFVVNHVADKFKPALDFLPDDDSRGRLLRYQFYQPEVLTRLGYTLSSLSNPIASAEAKMRADLDALDTDISSKKRDEIAALADKNDPKKLDTVRKRIVDDASRVVKDAGDMRPTSVALGTEVAGLSTALNTLTAAVGGGNVTENTSTDSAMQYAGAVRMALNQVLSHTQTSATATLPATSADGSLTQAELAADDAFVTRFTLPDPAHASTLGEMLFVLSLGKQTYREAVLTHFLLSLESIPINLPGFKSNDPTMNEQRVRLTSFTAGLITTVAEGIADNRNLYTASDYVKVRDLFSHPDVLKQDRHVQTLKNNMMLSDVEMEKLLQLVKASPPSANPEQENADRFYPRFPSAILGSFPNFGSLPLANGYEEMTGNQNEILLAIQAQGRDSVANEVNNLLQRINSLAPADRGKSLYAHTLRLQYLPLIGLLNSKYYSPRTAVPGATWFQQGLLAVGALSREAPLNLSPLDLTSCENQLSKIEASDTAKSPLTALNGTTWKTMDQQAWQIASLSGQHNSLSRATPRVAAADDMIKRLIITVEDDLDYFFVQPELEAIRKEVVRPGVEFGSIQREGLLVTNRRVGRVDPRANADPELSGGTDFLAEASQLGQLYDRFRQEQGASKIVSSGATAAGGIASLLGSPLGTAAGIGAVASLFGDMLTTPQPAGEIYSINSGNLFKVTPIFDPSGQALRFQFDYAGVTDVREPDGTTNPSIPRVERHTVDDDVQLTNLELREVSRFESNNALGTPERRTGGLPLLKELPILKDIPIIGYYTRTAKKAATRQESLIFAQTSMYPTVADIVNLLVDIPPLPVAPRSIPAYLNNEKPPTAPQPAGDVHRTVTLTAAGVHVTYDDFGVTLGGQSLSGASQDQLLLSSWPKGATGGSLICDVTGYASRTVLAYLRVTADVGGSSQVFHEGNGKALPSGPFTPHQINLPVPSGTKPPTITLRLYADRPTPTDTAVVRVDALNVRFSPTFPPKPKAGLSPMPVALRSVRRIHVPVAPPLPVTPGRNRLKPVGNNPGNTGSPLPRRGPAKQAAAVSDFILPTGMQPR